MVFVDGFDTGSEYGSEASDSISRLLIGEPNTVLDSSSSHDESVASSAFNDVPGSIIPNDFRKFGKYDTIDQEFEEVDSSLSPEEQLLMQEIEKELRRDEEISREVTRSSLFRSPLLMAATVEIIQPGSEQYLSRSKTQHAQISKVQETESEYYSDEDSNLDGDVNENDFVFGKRTRTSGVFQHQSLEQPGSKQLEAFDQESSIFDRNRRLLSVAGWALAAVLVISLGVALIVRQTSINKNPAQTFPPLRYPTVSPKPSSYPSISSNPTIFSKPTLSPGPTNMTSPISRSRSPSQRQTQAPSEQIDTPSRTPTLSPTPFRFPVDTSPSSSPSKLKLTSFPTTISPTTKPIPQIEPTILPSALIKSTPPSEKPSPLPTVTEPTLSPTVSPTTLEPSKLPSKLPVELDPTFKPSTISSQPSNVPLSSLSLKPVSSEEETRRADIKSMLISISGVIVLLDSWSPQSRAMQWIMSDDPMNLDVKDTPMIVQRYSLATLYFATNGDKSWNSCGPNKETTVCQSDSMRFLSGEPECSWLGINCDYSQAITGINIRGNGLEGVLPDELGELTQLTSLSFGGNSLYGVIPFRLRWLNRLRFLILNSNNYFGTIPAFLGELTTVSYLHLGNNNFEGTIPFEIFTQSLQHLDLGSNFLQGTIPSEIFTISQNLRHIDLSNNGIIGTIPAGVGNLVALDTFSVMNNTLTGTLPANLITDHIAVLDLGVNKLQGTLPSEIYSIGSSLTFLNLGVNNFEGSISSQFGNLLRLQTLVFFFTQLTGTIPTELGQLTALKVLHLAGTLIKGNMPMEICSLAEQSLKTLTADCLGTNSDVSCSCCTLCY